MLCVVIVIVFDAKVINADTEFYFSCFVFSYAHCSDDGLVLMWLKICLKVVVRKYCTLFQATHTFLNLNVNIFGYCDFSL